MPETFIQRHTEVGHADLVPEIALCLAREPQRIFQVAERRELQGERFPPFWAFAWPGGQALARHILDTPSSFAGRRILDIGAGSGIASIAAARAGARAVFAADIDPFAEAAIKANAALNGVEIATTTRDILGEAIDADIVLIADLVYEPALATRVAAFLEAAARAGTPVLLADRTTARRPPLEFALIAEFDAPLTPELLDDAGEKARLWRLAPRLRTKSPRK